jgi:hypothetical protein
VAQNKMFINNKINFALGYFCFHIIHSFNNNNNNNFVVLAQRRGERWYTNKADKALQSCLEMAKESLNESTISYTIDTSISAVGCFGQGYVATVNYIASPICTRKVYTSDERSFPIGSVQFGCENTIDTIKCNAVDCTDDSDCNPNSWCRVTE